MILFFYDMWIKKPKDEMKWMYVLFTQTIWHHKHRILHNPCHLQKEVQSHIVFDKTIPSGSSMKYFEYIAKTNPFYELKYLKKPINSKKLKERFFFLCIL